MYFVRHTLTPKQGTGWQGSHCIEWKSEHKAENKKKKLNQSMYIFVRSLNL
jgi:hypothetical protein